MGVWQWHWNQSSIILMKASRRAKTEKTTSISVKWEGFAHCFLWMQWHGASHEFLFQVVRSIRTAILKLCANCAKQFVRNAQNCGKTNHGFLNHDNAPAHTSMLGREFLAKNKTVIMSQPPYSPDLAPADFFSLPKTEDTDKREGFCYDWGDKRKIEKPKCAFQRIGGLKKTQA